MKRALLDANILQFGINPDYAPEITRILGELQSDGCQSIVSEYTKFEVYRGRHANKIPLMRALIDSFGSLTPSVPTYKIAAMLATCYGTHAATNGNPKQYSDGDIILAALTFEYDDAYVLTGDLNDFPRPFFAEEKRFTIASAKGRVSQHLALLRPDRHVFNDMRKECYPELKTSG